MVIQVGIMLCLILEWQNWKCMIPNGSEKKLEKEIRNKGNIGTVYDFSKMAMCLSNCLFFGVLCQGRRARFISLFWAQDMS